MMCGRGGKVRQMETVKVKTFDSLLVDIVVDVWFALGSWRIRLQSQFEKQGYLSEPSCSNFWFSVLSEIL